MQSNFLAHACVAAALAVAGTSGRAAAQDTADTVAQFYRGKTINLIAGTHIGGGFDAYARLLARHLGKYIPGNPTVLTQNMPGAGSNKAAGFLYSQAPKDGSAIGAVQPNALLAPLLGNRPVAQDPTRFLYLGSANSDVLLCIVRADAPVKSFAEAFTKEVILGADADAAQPHDMPSVLNNVLGTRFRLVSGYQGSHDLTLAIERGEVQGMCGMSWASLSMQHPDWIKSGFIRVLVQDDPKGHPELNKLGVPRSIDFAKTEDAREVMELIYSQAQFGRPYVIPPGVTAARVAALRGAFIAAMKDKDLLADAAKSRLDITAMSGEDLQAMVTHLYKLPPNIIAQAKQALIYKPPEK